MSRHVNRLLVLSVAILISSTFVSGICMADESAQQQLLENVRSSLAEMHDWVGTGKNGQNWKAYLDSDKLQAQIEKGQGADPKVLEQILAQYNSGASGLDQDRFIAVRTALAAWLKQLQENPLPKRSEITSLAKKSKKEFREIKPEEIEQARQQVIDATKRLSEFLAPGTANTNAWHDYLRWKDLNAELNKKTEPDNSVLGDVYRRLTANHTGLESKYFRDIASALRHYVDLVAFESMRKRAIEQGSTMEAIYEKELDSLAKSLEQYAKQPDEETNFAIARRIGWLQGLGQANELVRAVRYHHSRPNLFIEASKPLVVAGIERKIDQTENIRDVILGTSISGTGKTTGTVTGRLIPNPSRATIETVIQGRTVSDTVGYNGPVTLYSDGVTTFSAQKRIFIDQLGFDTAPAQVTARTNSNVRNIAGGAIATRTAWSRVAESRGQANAIASRKARGRIAEKVNQESSKLTVKANKNFNREFRHPLLRKREFPEILLFSTTEDHLYVKALQANRFQLAAPSDPPELQATHDLGVRAHETMINNLAAAFLAGQTMDDEDFQEIAKKFNDGKLPEEMKNQEDEDPWSITFASYKPVTIAFDGNKYQVTIRGQRYTSGERKFTAMNVVAEYTLAIGPEGILAKRIGEIAILPPGFEEGKSRLSAAQIALKKILERKFSKVFKPELTSDGLELPGEWKKLGKLKLVEVATSDGWIKAAWKIPAKKAQ